jgi:hypothetical protein
MQLVRSSLTTVASLLSSRTPLSLLSLRTVQLHAAGETNLVVASGVAAADDDRRH